MKISRRSSGGAYRAIPPPEVIDALALVTTSSTNDLNVIAETDWIGRFASEFAHGWLRRPFY